jgi:hypothetical protein
MFKYSNIIHLRNEHVRLLGIQNSSKGRGDLSLPHRVAQTFQTENDKLRGKLITKYQIAYISCT